MFVGKTEVDSCEDSLPNLTPKSSDLLSPTRRNASNSSSPPASDTHPDLHALVNPSVDDGRALFLRACQGIFSQELEDEADAEGISGIANAESECGKGLSEAEGAETTSRTPPPLQPPSQPDSFDPGASSAWV